MESWGRGRKTTVAGKALVGFGTAILILLFQQAVRAETTADAFKEAEIRIVEGDGAAAVSLFTGVIESSGDTVDEKARARNGIGGVYFDRENFPEAMKNVQKTINDYPDAESRILAESRRGLGKAQFKTGSYQKAAEEFTKALACYPEAGLDFIARCQLDLAECFILQKRNVEAEEILEEVLHDGRINDPDIKASASLLLILAYRSEKTQTLDRWLPFITDAYESVLREYPSARLETLSDALYKLSKFNQYYVSAEKAFELASKEWIFSTFYESRNVEILWSNAKYFVRFDGNSARAARYLDYLRYGARGKDGIAGTADDLKNILPGYEKFTVQECRADTWPDQIGNAGFPPPPPIKTWEDLLIYFQGCFRQTGDDDRVNTEKIGNYVISCYKAIDGNTRRAKEFFRQEEFSSRGVKRAVTGRILRDLNGQDRMIDLLAGLVDNFRGFDGVKEMLQQRHTPAEQNEWAVSLGRDYLKQKLTKEARTVFKTFLENPLVDEEKTVTDMARELFAIKGPVKEMEDLDPYWEELLIWKMTSGSPGEARFILRGVVAALRERNQDEKIERLCRFCLESFPDEEIAEVALAEMPAPAEFCQSLIEKYPGTRVAGAARVKLAEISVQAGDYQKGKALAEEYLRTNPPATNRLPVLEKLEAWYQATGEQSRAITLYREAADAAADTQEKAALLGKLAERYRRDGRIDEALKARRELARTVPAGDPRAGKIALESAELAFEAKRYQDAIGFYREAVGSLRPEDLLAVPAETGDAAGDRLLARAEFWKKYVEFVLGKNDKPAPDFSGFFSRYPDAFESAQGHYLLGKLALKKRDLTGAGDNAAAARKILPGNEEIAALSGEIDSRVRAAEEAGRKIADLKEKLKTETSGEKIAEGRFRIGELYLEKGEPAAAVAEWEETAKSYPESASAPGALEKAALVYGKEALDRKKMKAAWRELGAVYPENNAGFIALLHFTRFGPGESFLTGSGPGEKKQMDWAGIKTAYSRGDYERTVAQGLSRFRQLVRAHPELEKLSRKIAVICQAEREVKAELNKPIAVSAANVASPDEITVPYLTAFYRLAGLILGSEEYSRTGLTEEEKGFLDMFEDAWLGKTDREIAATWAEFSSGRRGEAEMNRGAESVLVYLLLTRDEKQIFAGLEKTLASGYPGDILAAACAGLGKTTCAFTLFEKAAELSPDAAGKIPLLEKEGLLYEKLKNCTGAIEVYRKLVQDFPDSPLAAADQLRIGKLYAERLKSFDLAVGECQNLLAKFPRAPEAVEAQLLLGRYAYLNKNNDVAIGALEEFVRKYPDAKDLVTARYLLALAKLDKNPEQKAVEELADLIAAYPKHESAAEAQYEIGQYYISILDYQKAESEFRKLVEKYPFSDYADRAWGFLNRKREGKY